MFDASLDDIFSGHATSDPKWKCSNQQSFKINDTDFLSVHILTTAVRNSNFIDRGGMQCTYHRSQYHGTIVLSILFEIAHLVFKVI